MLATLFLSFQRQNQAVDCAWDVESTQGAECPPTTALRTPHLFLVAVFLIAAAWSQISAHGQGTVAEWNPPSHSLALVNQAADWAQTFTPLLDGELDEIGVAAQQFYGGIFPLPEVRIIGVHAVSNGILLTPPIASVSVPTSPLAAGSNWLVASFGSAAIRLVAGSQYAFSISYPRLRSGDGHEYDFTVFFEDGTHQVLKDRIKTWVTQGPSIAVSATRGSVTVRWQDLRSMVPGLHHYWVEIEGPGLSVERNDVPPTTTSVTFKNAAFAPGRTYAVIVYVFDELDDFAYQQKVFKIP